MASIQHVSRQKRRPPQVTWSVENTTAISPLLTTFKTVPCASWDIDNSMVDALNPNHPHLQVVNTSDETHLYTHSPTALTLMRPSENLRGASGFEMESEDYPQGSDLSFCRVL